MGPDPVRFDETLHQRALANVRAFDRRSAAIDGHRPAAVAVVLLPDDAGRACFLLTRRAASLRTHTSQWALPGGRVNPGETAPGAALRELREEVGLGLAVNPLSGANMSMLAGKTALVTGAGRGIGRGIARALAKAGAKVVVNDLGVSLSGEGTDKQPAAQLADEIVKEGGSAAANFGSVAEPNDASAMVRQVVDTWGRIDILVHVAGILRDRMIFNMTDTEWDAVLDV